MLMIYFFENYVHNNKNINTIVINNLGNINYDKECYNKMKDKEKIKVPNLRKLYMMIIYSKKIKMI